MPRGKRPPRCGSRARDSFGRRPGAPPRAPAARSPPSIASRSLRICEIVRLPEAVASLSGSWMPAKKKRALSRRWRNARSAYGPSSSPKAASTFSAEARTCCTLAEAFGRLSPLTSSKCVKAMMSLRAFPVAMTSRMAASGAACIGWVALSTRSTASVASMRRLTAVETAEDDVGVWPSPSPSRRTSFGTSLPFQVGEKGPATRTPFTRGRQQPPEEGRVVAGEARDRAEKRGALLDRPLSAPRQRPALPRLLDLSGRQQVEALLDLLHQCIGHLVEPLVVPQQIVQLLLEELLGHALVVVPTDFELGAQLVTEATSRVRRSFSTVRASISAVLATSMASPSSSERRSSSPSDSSSSSSKSELRGATAGPFPST